MRFNEKRDMYALVLSQHSAARHSLFLENEAHSGKCLRFFSSRLFLDTFICKIRNLALETLPSHSTTYTEVFISLRSFSNLLLAISRDCSRMFIPRCERRHWLSFCVRGRTAFKEDDISRLPANYELRFCRALDLAEI